MNIVIVGLGKYGTLLTDHLSKENHDIIVIDTNAKVIEEVVNQYDVKGYAYQWACPKYSVVIVRAYFFLPVDGRYQPAFL